MAVIETEGLILRNYNLSDADKIVIFLTKSEGLVRGVAKGAKRLKSKFGGSLEPFSIVNLEYYQKEQNELVSIRQIDLQTSYFKDASDIKFLEKFSYLADLLIEFAPPHDPNERLYQMSKVCLETAALNLQALNAVSVYFELWILKLGGYLPSWNKCDKCKREFSERESASLQSDFHLFCNDCQKSSQRYSVDSTQRKIYILVQSVSPQKFINLTRNEEAELIEISIILKKIIANVLGKEKFFSKKVSVK